ncbi:very long chain fatty acid elongase 7-like [Epargyreus clarus]|uniref:very long chain fatty acid elongase 7-like n=1 Tax=Epargyreus clarus TaxID=520877 RepID=UPI003C2E1B08
MSYLQVPKGKLNFVDKWPLMNFNDVAFVLLTYLLFILKVGPVFMEGRSPFLLKRFLLIYNAVKVVNSTVLAYKFLCYINDKGLFPRKCEHDERTLYIIAALYWKYMATKILDLLDTIFFVLRKKYNQMTFLHVYHHVFMVMITWWCLKYDPSDHWAFMAFMNCSIHVIMYSYYGMAALGPRYTKYLWWKKYLTMMQLIQFFLVIAHIVVQTYTSQCPMHIGSYVVSLANLALFICLFTDFYYKRYKDKGVTIKPIGLACCKQDID